jgi:AraC family transcriptional activator of tynA and feaB
VAADDINVVVVLDGSATVDTLARQDTLHGGDIFYLPASHPSTLHAGAACRMLVLRLSFRRFCNGQGGKFSDFRIALARRDAPLSLAVFHYVQHVLPSLGDSALATVAHAEQAFIAMIAAVYAEASAAPDGAAHNRWEQLVLAVDVRLHDADLDVSTLAAALAITPRHVHRLFASQGARCGAYLLAQRLARAREDLRRPMLAGVGVAQIGYRVGFNSASHFSRSFKQRYGVAPQAWRAQAG